MIFDNFVVTCSWCACFRYTRRMEDEVLIEAVRDYQCLYNSKCAADFKVVKEGKLT